VLKTTNGVDLKIHVFQTTLLLILTQIMVISVMVGIPLKTLVLENTLMLITVEPVMVPMLLLVPTLKSGKLLI